MGLGSRGGHRVVDATAIACQGDGSTADGEALDAMDVGCWLLPGPLGRIGWSTVVDTACIRGRYVLHMDCGMVLPAKVEGNALRSLGVAHIGLGLCCMALGVPLVKP